MANKNMTEISISSNDWKSCLSKMGGETFLAAKACSRLSKVNVESNLLRDDGAENAEAPGGYLAKVRMP
jgi:hypothetical protein